MFLIGSIPTTDWVSEYRTPEHITYVNVELIESPEIIWSFEEGGPYVNAFAKLVQPLVTKYKKGEMVVLGTEDGYVCGIMIKYINKTPIPTLKWRKEIGTMIGGLALGEVHGVKAVFVGGYNEIFALELDDGEILWRTDLGDIGTTIYKVFYYNKKIVGVGQGDFVGVLNEHGEVLWNLTWEHITISRPDVVVGNGQIYLFGPEYTSDTLCYLWILDINTGAVIKRFSSHHVYPYHLILMQDRMLVYSGGVINIFDLSEGIDVFSVDGASCLPGVDSLNMYTVLNKDTLVAVSLKDGSIVWNVSIPETEAIVAVKDGLYVSTKKGLYLYAKNGTFLDSVWGTSGGFPVVLENHLYIVDGGALHYIGTYSLTFEELLKRFIEWGIGFVKENSGNFTWLGFAASLLFLWLRFKTGGRREAGWVTTPRD